MFSMRAIIIAFVFRPPKIDITSSLVKIMISTSAPSSPWRQQIETELTGNILPFWMAHALDRGNGGFYGAITNDLQVHNEVPRSAILCARLLWTFATAYRKLGQPEYLQTAKWAYDYLTSVFWDQEYGGVYWSVNPNIPRMVPFFGI